jgi:uncharacterized protein YdaU (DUF1376 family)
VAEVSHLPWIKLFPSDHVASTRSLTLAERGALFDLMCFAWMQGTLPRDPRRLAALIGASAAEFKSLWPGVKPFFRSSRGGWIHPAIEELRTQSLDQRAKAKSKAQTAANARWNPPRTAASGPRSAADVLAALPGRRP